MRTPLALLPALLLLSACDATATAGAKSDATVDVAAPIVAVHGEVKGEALGEVNEGVALDANADAHAVAEVDVAARADLVADGKLTVSAEAFKLGTVTTLVQSGTIETAEELELAINDPESDINTLDIDLDGKIDHVEVIEVREDARVDFQMRVIPSSKASVEHSVELASASLVAVRAASEVSFSASFSASVSFSAGASAQAQLHTFVMPATFEASAVVVGLPLLSWAFVAERPIYHSVFIEAKTGRWIPPGHLKHGLWKATGEHSRGGGNGHGSGKFAGHVGGEVHGKAGKSGPVKHAGKAEASNAKHASASKSGSGASKSGSGASKSGSSGGSKSGSGANKSGSNGGSKSGSSKSGSSKSGSSGGGKGGKGK